MTFIAGYIYKKTVQIIADSAETFIMNSGISPASKTFTSSFREVTETGEKFAVEGAQKIYNIDNKLIFAFAGDVTEGVGVFADVNMHYKNYQSVSEFLKNYFNQNIFFKTQYVVAFFDENGPGLFYCYENGEYAFCDERNIACVVGTGNYGFGHYFPYWYEEIVKNNFLVEDALAYMIASVQRHTIQFETIKNGVGGFINGCYLSKGDFKWANDAICLMYSSVDLLNGDQYWIHKFNRENSVVLIPSGTDGNFRLESLKDLNESLSEDIINDISSRVESYSADYYIFICYDALITVIVHNKIKEKIGLRITDNRIYFDEPILKWMHDKRVDPEGDPALTMIFRFE